jgi:RNA-directed DNA polymerase
LFIKPAKQAVKRFLGDIRELIKANGAAKTEALIQQLNSKIRGWSNYYRHVVAKKTFGHVDDQVFRALMAWIDRRHPGKSAEWKRRRYFRSEGLRNWVFSTTIRDGMGRLTGLDLFRASSVEIVRHIKIQGDANPYDPAYRRYFALREKFRRVSTLMWRGMVAAAS